MGAIVLSNYSFGCPGIAGNRFTWIIIFTINIQVDGNQKDIMFFSITKMFHQPFDHAMLISSILPSGLAAGIVGAKSIL